MCLAIPGQIVDMVEDDRSLAVVDVLGVRRKVDLGLIIEDQPVSGDWVLIHVGFAMSKYQRGGCAATAAHADGCWAKATPRWRRCGATAWKEA